ncbi:MAG: hypothetical protein H6512_10665 [Acidimicrobiia bacterium]|nr:hypothetical protein [Acidimicrobiia bacterium]
MRTSTQFTSTLFAAALLLGACGSSNDNSSTSSTPQVDNQVSAQTTTVGAGAGSASAAQTVPAGAVDPNAPEVVEPGDIPDDQVFVPYESADGVFSVDVPEGWARSENQGSVTFTDKYNSITIDETTATAAPTVQSVKGAGLADVSKDPSFNLVDVAPVTRSSGDGILALYEIASEPNAVTGKRPCWRSNDTCSSRTATR